MNFDYIRMLTYIEIKSFIESLLKTQFKTNFIVKLGNVTTNSLLHHIEFEAIGSNGMYFNGEVTCTNFACIMKLNDKKCQMEDNYNKDWAKWLYTILKAKDFDARTRTAEIYKADYNEHCQKIRDAKRKQAEKECEASLLA